MTNKELKPCPFCGGEAEIGISLGNTYVICKYCCAATRQITIKANNRAVDKAVEFWNRRANNE